MSKRILLTLLSLVVAAGVWLPGLHLFYRPRLEDYFQAAGIPPQARALAEWQLDLWTDPASRAQELQRMRATNAEWDFMGRTFLVLSLANMALREPEEQARYLGVMDVIIDETLQLEKEHGIYFFLMDYARHGTFVNQPARSLFEDGEIALMLAARLAVADKPDYRPALQERARFIENYMRRGPVLCAESYPDECWMFCNAVALAALRMTDALTGTDHTPLFREWVAKAQTNLRHPETGLLVSSFSLTGEVVDGPEGSSIWMVAHCLQIVDPAFAADQYRRAKRELGASLLGFGYAREWPASWRGPTDVDSGPIIPGVEASAGSSGQAFIAARAFGDDAFLARLLRSLELAGFPTRREGRLKFAASNQVGDAVLLYSMVQGPLWEKISKLWGVSP